MVTPVNRNAEMQKCIPMLKPFFFACFFSACALYTMAGFVFRQKRVCSLKARVLCPLYTPAARFRANNSVFFWKLVWASWYSLIDVSRIYVLRMNVFIVALGVLHISHVSRIALCVFNVKVPLRWIGLRRNPSILFFFLGGGGTGWGGEPEN